MKKLLLSLISTVTISSNLLSMDGINLKLGEKPSYISTYEWCKQRAEKFVLKKRLAVLDALNIKSEREFNRKKRDLESLMPKNKLKKQIEKIRNSYVTIVKNQKHNKKKTLPEPINKAILNVLKKPLVKNELGITKISKENGIITAERNGHTKIKFMNDVEGDSFTDGVDIFINDEFFFKHDTLTQGLEGVIGHELGHILCKHHDRENLTDDDFFLYEYENNKMKINKSEEECLGIYFDWIKARETQADIVGIFNDPKLAKTMEIYFSITNGHLEGDEEHPSNETRARYFKEIHRSMLKENLSSEKPFENKFKLPTKPFEDDFCEDYSDGDDSEEDDAESCDDAFKLPAKPFENNFRPFEDNFEDDFESSKKPFENNFRPFEDNFEDDFESSKKPFENNFKLPKKSEKFEPKKQKESYEKEKPKTMPTNPMVEFYKPKGKLDDKEKSKTKRTNPMVEFYKNQRKRK